MFDWRVVRTIAMRTFRQSVESPIAYVVAIFFYGVVGGIFGFSYFVNNQAALAPLTQLAPWIFWLVVPALTMGLLSEEFRTGTFEQLATLPVRDTEIVAGKFLGFAMLAFCLVAGLGFLAVIVAITAQPMPGVDWGATIGVLGGLYFLSLVYGAMGIFASSLSKNQVVALILGMVFCTVIFFLSLFSSMFPSVLGQLAESIGIVSHIESMGRGVWDLRDLVYFFSLIFIFLYLSVQRLSTRRF